MERGLPMPKFKIVVLKRPNLKLPGFFTAAQMREIGAEAIAAMKARNARAQDVFDAENQPLSKKYGQRKVREGAKPVRDLRLTGELMDSLQVTEASSGEAKIAVVGPAYRKGLFNQNRDSGHAPWFGISPDDRISHVMPLAQRIFGDNVTHFADIGKE
jgi:hypothetical protein